MRGDARRTTILLLLILLLALVLRLWLWSRPAHPLANDETEYYPVALDLAHGRGFVFYDSYRWLRAPLYSLFLAIWLRIGGDDGRLATLVQVLLSTATVYLFYRLGRRFFPGGEGERVGLVSALLAALLLPFATFPSLFMSETLFTLLLVAFLLVLLGVPAARRRWAWTLGAGGLLGLCALTRSVGLAFLPLAAGWLFFALRTRHVPCERVEGSGSCQEEPAPLGAWPRLGLAALFVLAGLAPIAPWTARNAAAYGHLIPLDTGASFNLWVFYEPHEELEEIRRQLEAIPNPADRQAYALSKSWERIQEDPLILLRKIPRTFPNLIRIKPIEDRFLNAPYREPALPYFLLAMVLDDGLYVLITLGSLLAFLFTGKSQEAPPQAVGRGSFRHCRKEPSRASAARGAASRSWLFPWNLPRIVSRPHPSPRMGLPSEAPGLALGRFTPGERGKTLALLWLFYNIAVMVVLHAEARYRQLLFPVMIPYAALALVQGRRLGAHVRQQGAWWRVALLVLFLAGWGAVFVAYSPWEWIGVGLQRGFHQAVGRVNWVLDRPAAALEAYRRAVEADAGNPETYYDLGWVLERMGRLEEAAQAYRWGWDLRATYLPCSTALGNVLRQLGRLEEARQAFQGRFVAESEVLSWSWEHLQVQPQDRIDVGEGLDYGYVSAMHAPEDGGGFAFRWTTAQATLRLTPSVSGQAQLRLRLAAPRMGNPGPVQLTARIHGTEIGRWEVSPYWEVYESPPFEVDAEVPLEIRLESASFVPQQADPASSDTRDLGVQLDWVEIVIPITGSRGSSGYTEFTPFP